jgi:acyl carrier protein
MNQKQQIILDLNEIFTDIIDEGEITLSPETTANDIDGWDSLNHIQILAAVEKKYAFKFTLTEIQNLKNIDDLINIIVQKTSA